VHILKTELQIKAVGYKSQKQHKRKKATRTHQDMR